MKVSLRILSDNKPNLLFHKSKVTGKSLEVLLSARIPVPKFIGEALFGIYPVLQSLEIGKRNPYKLYIKDSVRNRPDVRIDRILELANEKKIPVLRLTQAQLDRITDFQLHNGICLDTSSLSFMQPTTKSISVYLDRVLDPQNIGAIARSCEFFGVEQILYSHGPSSITPTMSKSSCGAFEKINFVHLGNDDELFTKLDNTFLIGTSDPTSAKRYKKELTAIENIPNLKGKNVIIVLGDEHGGISKELMSRCNILTTVKGSQNAITNSLNVSVLAGIILQEIYRKMKI